LTEVVVDSSVAAKWFLPEPLSEAAELLLDPAFTLCAPDLLVPELGNVLWKRVTRGQLPSAEARDIVGAFGKVPIELVSSSRLLPSALEIALAYKRTAYDALYIALAVARDCIFVTADERLVHALRVGALSRHVRALSMGIA
jgi:predicted nucleic acid-binding protein